MPKALKAHPGERLDLVDYVQGANTYTQETQKFSTEREWLDRRSRILDGFRIRVEDQATYPGLITVFNGDALDRTGQLINNEELVNDARSLTLLGANLTFYVEIEFTDVESDTDARYFWDPTIPNTPPEPDGSEFSINVATRLTPDWRVVTPVSTTGFQQTSNPNSIRIPVGVFRTDGGNQIASGIDNPGLSLVRPASVLETDIAVGVSQIRVVDARIFPAVPFNITLDLGGAAPEARTVSAIDRDNGILTLGVATGFVHSAGAIVRVTSANFDIVQQRTDPNFPAFDPAAVFPNHPDPTQRMWQGDEVRGSALIQSKETFGARDDLNVRSLKDEIDYLAAQIREMKFGHPRPEVKSAAPPLSFAGRPRYFDPAGSIQGAKSNTVSIGNGTTTFGDFNGSDENVFIAAIGALPATGGVVYVKSATYGFNNTVFIGKPVTFVGEGLTATTIINNVVAGPAFSTSSQVSFHNLKLSRTTGLGVAVDITASTFLDFTDCQVETGLRINGSVNVGIRAYKTLFIANTAVPVVTETGGGTLIQSEFRDCYLVTTSIAISCPVNNVLISNCYILAASLFLTGGASDDIQKLKVENSQILVTSVLFASVATQVVVDVLFVNNQVTVSNLAAANAVFAISSTVASQNFRVINNKFVISATTSTSASPAFVVAAFASTSAALLCFERNAVVCPSGGYIVGLGFDLVSTNTPVIIAGNTFVNNAEMVRLGSALNQMTSGEYQVVDNSHDNAGNTDAAYGVRLFDKPAVSFVRVARNSFLNYDNAGSGNRYGVDCTWDSAATTTAAPQIVVEHNYFDNFAGTGVAAAVFFDAIATTPGGGMVKVLGNRICRITSDGGAYAAGVYLAPVSGAQISFQVADNNIFYIGSGSLPYPDNAYGVYCGGINLLEVDNNSIHRVSTANAAGEAVSIYLNACGSTSVSRSQAVVSNNSCGWATGNSAPVFPAGGRLIHVEGNSYFIKIIGNACSQRGTISASGSRGITVNTDQCRGLTISNNSVLSTTDTASYGIEIVRATSTAALIQDVLVSDNFVEVAGSAAATAISAIVGGNSSGIVIDGNVIREINLVGSRVGIYVQGHNNPTKTRSVVVRNNTLIGIKAGGPVNARIGVYVSDCEYSTISGNHIDWLESGVARGNGIYLNDSLADTWNQFSVVGNFITPDGNVATNEIELDNAAMLYGILDSNVVGNGLVPGTITPPSLDWTYGTNKIS